MTITNDVNDAHVLDINLLISIITIPPALHHNVRLVINKQNNEDSTANL